MSVSSNSTDFYDFCFRNGVLGAEYLPLRIKFDKETKRIYPEPLKNDKWITVCGKEDTQCQKSCKNSSKRTRKGMS